MLFLYIYIYNTRIIVPHIDASAQQFFVEYRMILSEMILIVQIDVQSKVFQHHSK